MTTYDCVIVGGGIAGLSAALYTARANLKTLVIEASQYGGQIVNSLEVENYPGVEDSISGYDLTQKLLNQVKNLNVEFLEDEVIELKNNEVITKNNVVSFKTAIVASGLKRRSLGVEDDFIGKGVSYCATCDGAFFRNKDVAVVGGGNTALEDVLYLSNLAKKVYLIHRREEFRAEYTVLARVKERENVEFVLNSEIKSIYGDNVLEGVILNNDRKIPVSGLFIAIGLSPETRYLNNILRVDENGFVVSEDTRTNLENVFVAGDVRTKDLRQLITAASDGAIAATNCINYININS